MHTRCAGAAPALTHIPQILRDDEMRQLYDDSLAHPGMHAPVYTSHLIPVREQNSTTGPHTSSIGAAPRSRLACIRHWQAWSPCSPSCRCTHYRCGAGCVTGAVFVHGLAAPAPRGGRVEPSHDLCRGPTDDLSDVADLPLYRRSARQWRTESSRVACRACACGRAHNP